MVSKRVTTRFPSMQDLVAKIEEIKNGRRFLGVTASAAPGATPAANDDDDNDDDQSAVDDGDDEIEYIETETDETF